jgi:carboxylesterase type B
MADAVVRTDRGAVRGVVGDDVACFRGTPFASAPEGPLRFLPPVPAAARDGVRDAVEFGTAPPQASPAPGVPSAWRPADGLDRLTLNVWSPDLGAAGLPVMVWIYGGMWKIGSSGMPQYDAAALAQSVPDGYRTTAEAGRVTRALAAAAGVAATREGLAGLAPEALVAVQDAPLAGHRSGRIAFGPVIVGDLVTGPPWTALPAGARLEVDLICGFTHEEYKGIGPEPTGAGIDLATVTEVIGLGAKAASAYRAAWPGSTDDRLFTAMMSDALVRMPSTWTAEAHAWVGGRTWLYETACMVMFWYGCRQYSSPRAPTG